MNEYFFAIITFFLVTIFIAAFVTLLSLHLYYWAIGSAVAVFFTLCIYNTCKKRPKTSFTHKDITNIHNVFTTNEIRHDIHQGGEHKGGEYKE